jgi:hypothetical protein
MFEGGLRLGDRDARPFLENPHGPSVGGVVVGSGRWCQRGVKWARTSSDPTLYLGVLPAKRRFF